MACFNRMPDLVISLDTVFYPDFDVSISTNIIHVVFYLPAIEMTIVKKLREGVSYNKARNKLYIWLTNDDLSKIRKSSMVQLQVRIVDIFTDEMFCSTAHIVNMEPIIMHRDKLITFDKLNSKTFKIDYDDPEVSKFMEFLKYGDRCNQNDHDDAIDALRYATKNWLRTKHDIIGKVTDIHLTPNGLNFHVTPCNNHDTRVKEKPMKTKKDIDRIVITKNDLNEVLLRAYSGDEIIEKTIAKCSPDDIFDFNIGAKLAVDRLYDGYDMTPKPKKRKLYNGMIFVAKYPGTILKPNTLYRVRNGVLILGREPFIFENMSDDDLTKAVYHTLYSPGGTMDQIKRSTAIHFAKEGKYGF